MKKVSTRGFTLIEVLLVIAILAILAAVVIIALNPAKQLAEAQNAQRRSDVRAILDAVHQYSVDNMGSLPVELPMGTTCLADGVEICTVGNTCSSGGVDLYILTDETRYLVDIPSDPTAGTDHGTGYYIVQNGGNRVGVCAPSASGGAVIEVMQ